MKKYNFMNDPEGGSESVSVNKTRKKKLDLMPKILCFLFAVFIWIYMVNLNDTDIEETFTLTVEIVGEDALHQSGMAIYGMDNREVVITVKGSNRDLRKYTEKDYKVTVDVSSITSSGKHNIKLNFVPPTNSSIEVVKTEPSSISLYSDVNLEKEIPMKVELGDVITYQNAEPILTQSAQTVKIMGPNAIIDKIDYAVYHINGDLDSSVIYSGFTLEFFGSDNAKIPLESYEYIDYSTKDITVNVDVLLHRTIPIKVEIVGESDIIATVDTAQVSVYGDRLLMKQLENLSYVITLSQTQIPSSGVSVNYTLKNDDLPEGVFLEEDTVKKIVKINFEKNPATEIETSKQASGGEENK